MKQDIIDRKDIELLVNTFYNKVQQNPLLSNVFDTVMQINWQTHLPIMYNFWESILFHTTTYNGSPFPVHTEINKKIKLTNEHFDNWIELFTQTVDELFVGKKADEAKLKANSIKHIFNTKINYINS